MVEVNSDNDISVFKDAILDDNLSVQVDAVKRLPILASAIEPERTREELLPCVANCVEAMQEESCFNLAEQLERLVPLVGGSDHVSSILSILVKLAGEDETLVRDRAVEAMRNICRDMSNEQCETSFFPVIENLISSDWFTTKCSAGCLISICYAKMAPEKQDDLRIFFRNLIQDESPMVRRATANSVVDLIALLEPIQIISEFVPVLHNLSQDEQDSVRTLAVDVGIAISKKLKEKENYEYLLNTFKNLVLDDSWRVRQRMALRIHDIHMSEENRDEIIGIYRNCIRDEEPEVRVYAARNLYNFSVHLSDSYKNDIHRQDVFEKKFQEVITPEIHHMITDANEDVRVALSTNILSLSALLRNGCFNTNILPLVIDALEHEEFMPFKENMLKNLNSLPAEVDITKSLKSIRNVIQNLLNNSQMHWRTRRNLLLAFTHITRNTNTQFFDENLKTFFYDLLNDPIFAIRRTTPIILPLLTKQYGMDWAMETLIPIFVQFSKDPRYLFKYVALYGLDELILPTIDYDKDRDQKSCKYLEDLKELTAQSDQSKLVTETLFKIVILSQKLSKKLSEDEAFALDDDLDEEFSDLDTAKFYAEDTLDNLRKEHQVSIFSITIEEINKHSASYLEGVLLVTLQIFIKMVTTLLQDSSINVRERTKMTLCNMKRFSRKVSEEVEQPWVDEVIKQLSEDDVKRIQEELDEKLIETPESVSEEHIDCEMAEEDEDTEETNDNDEEQPTEEVEEKPSDEKE